MNEQNELEFNTIWLDKENALNNSHLDACYVLGKLLGDNDFINSICHGMACACNGDGLYFKHGISDILNPQSKVFTLHLEMFSTELSLEELYYYLQIAYQNYIEDGQYPETIKLFADGLEYFRKACDIKGTVHKENQ